MLNLRQGATRSRARLRTSLFLSSAVALMAASPAVAQIARETRTLDENGVDLVWGDFIMSFDEATIGSGDAALTLKRFSGLSFASQWDNMWLHRDSAGNTETVTVNLGSGRKTTFTGGGSSYAVTNARGETLTKLSPMSYTYEASDGTKLTFDNPSGDSEGGSGGFCGYYSAASCDMLPQSLAAPNGRTVSLEWDVWLLNSGFGETSAEWRLSKVTNSDGYAIDFNYADDSGSNGMPPSSDWKKRTSADFRKENESTPTQFSVSYSYPAYGTVDLTDPNGQVWQVTNTSIKRPGESTPSFSVSGPGAVTSVTRDGIATGYSRSVSGTTATMTVTNALNQTNVTVSDLAIGRPTSVTNGVGKTTSFEYDSFGRLTRVTSPEGSSSGGYTQYAYDGRGNVTSTTRKAKAGSGLADIVTSASYASTCSNALTCNKPTSTTDERGYVTNYTYGSTGLLTAVTRPAASGSGTGATTTYGYVLAGGGYNLDQVIECQTNVSCASNSSDAVVTDFDYDAHGNVASVTKRAGDSSLSSTTSATYDKVGNLVSVDGALSGTDDTTTYRYDAARRQVGVISADPDGSGSLKRRAQRTTYDGAGRVTDVEIGTATGTSDTDWSAFVSAQTTSSSYSGGYKTKDVLTSGSTTYQVMQYGYDAVGRMECTALRMKPSTWGSLPAACSNTSGGGEADRITKAVYDAAGRVTKKQAAYDTQDQADEMTLTYTDNGQVATVVDGEGNKTSYEYDGFDRLSKTSYPSTTQGAGTSSSSDYEQLIYDPASNVTTRRLRGYASDSSQKIDYAYDNLNRVTGKDLPGSEPDVTYSYDLLNRMTGASQPAHALTFGFDALSRNTSQGGPQGTVSYQYDAAGRRTRMTWPDTFYVDYNLLVTGEVSAIRENGASSGAGVLVSYSYDDLGRRTLITRGNGTSTTITPDAVSRLSSLAHDLASSGNDVTTSFSYNPASQIAVITRSNDGYAFDGFANVNRSDTINGLNQVAANGSTIMDYDARGNLKTIGSDSYTYSSENLLKSGPGGATLGYDPLLRLYEIGPNTTKLQHDGLDLIAEYDANNGLTRRYVHSSGLDEPVVSYQGAGTSDRRWLHADERSSIVVMTDSSGSPVANGIYSYDEHGLPAATNIGRFQYTGQAWLSELGMYYYKARMYLPTLGRFMQTDPIGYGDGMNLYAYAGGDPVNFFDPTGTERGIIVTGKATQDRDELREFLDRFGSGATVSIVNDSDSDTCRTIDCHIVVTANNSKKNARTETGKLGNDPVFTMSDDDFNAFVSQETQRISAEKNKQRQLKMKKSLQIRVQGRKAYRKSIGDIGKSNSDPSGRRSPMRGPRSRGDGEVGAAIGLLLLCLMMEDYCS